MMPNVTFSPSTQSIHVPDAKWEPVLHSVFKDDGLRDVIHFDGFAVVDFLDADQLEQLRAIHHREHQLDVEGGGMFYSIYSQDFAYRRRIHDEMEAILKPSFERYFKDYENIINLFIVKTPGPASEFALHQDTTAMDEKQQSPLSVWTPLWDVGPDSGAMCIVPKSHWFFSPYRGISFPFPFQNIKSTVRNYLQPIYLKAGQTLIFDPRLLHNSMENSSQNDRVSIVSGIFPPKTELITCFKEPRQPDAKIELIQHSNSFLFEYPNFFHNCHARPVTGQPIGFADIDMPQVTEKWFEDRCMENQVPKVSALPQDKGLNCQMISEPDEKRVLETAPAQAASMPSSSATAEKGFFGKVLSAMGLDKK